MPNPFFSNRVSPNGSTQPSEPVNEAHKKYSQGYSTFDLSVPHYISARYAELTPHESFECVEGDKIDISNSHNIRSEAFVGPFLNKVTMRKSYFAVDYRAFLHNSWKYIYPLSIDGDDIPNPEVNTCIVNFHLYLRYFHDSMQRIFKWANQDWTGVVTRFPFIQGIVLKYLLFLECFFSGGSLLRYLRSNFYTRFRNVSLANFQEVYGDNLSSYDDWIDAFFNSFLRVGIGFILLRYRYDNITYRFSYVAGNPPTYSQDYTPVGFRELLDIIREHPDCELEFYGFEDTFKSILPPLIYAFDISDSEFSDNLPFNFSRACAYQLICAQFYTNDKIDFIQSAEEYVDNMGSIIREWSQFIRLNFGDLDDYFNSEDFLTYEMNGVRVSYDYLSGHFLKEMLDKTSTLIDGYFRVIGDEVEPQGSITEDCFGFQQLFNYVMNLFTFRKNLRYGDYFTGARARPLAVGDVNTPVTSHGVSTLDSTRNLLIQRFRNAVNRVGDRLQDYIEGVLGGHSAPDVRIPRFLATITSGFDGYEVENTGESQGRIVTVVNSRDGNYVYNLEVGEPCIVIGITSFMARRVYAEASDRSFFVKDRYDMFNPFFQYSGDQAIYSVERNGRLGYFPFAYTLRNMEYKQRVPMATGAFINHLPGYVFITDNKEGDLSSRDNVDNESLVHITPDYIRSKNSEFDRFYPSLTGMSLSSYYHFYIEYQNNLICHRKMEYSPSML